MRKINDVRLNAVLNILKQLCAVVFPLITIPYISRVLGVDNYGKINFAVSVVSYFSIFAGLGVQNYGTREGASLRQSKPQLNRFASELFTLNSLSVLTAYAVLAGVLLFSGKHTDYTGLILVQSLSMVFTWLGMDWVNAAHEDYTYITLRYIAAQILSIIAMFLFVKDSEDYVIYAIINVLACYGVNLLNLFYVRKYVRVRLCFSKTIFRHLTPLLILMGNSLAVSIYVNSDTTLLGILKSDTEVGIYSIATKIYTIVKQLLNAMLIVFVPRLSALLSEKKQEEYQKTLDTLLNILICLLMPAIVGLMLLSSEIVALISGPNFIEAGRSLFVLCISLGFAVFACFFSNCILLPLKKDKMFLTATLAGCVVNVALNFVAIPLWGHVGAALTTVAAEAVVMVICLLYSWKYVRLSVSVKCVLSALVGCAAIVGVTLLAKTFLSGVLLLFVSIAGSVLLYVAVLAAFRNEFIMDFVKAIKKKK